MAIISASPNPVGIYGATVGGTTTITWDTQLGALAAGRVSVSVNGGPEAPLAGQAPSGAATGSLPLPVTLGNSYSVVLRRADLTNLELARVLVTTFDLRAQLAGSFASAYLPQFRPQAITNLSVQVGVDTVRFSFRTVKPTIPTTEILDDAGKWVDGRLPLLAGLQTRHEAVFGIERPLAQEMKHSFKIEAFGGTLNKNSPKKAVVTGEFTTGKRGIDIFFDSVDVHDDGDPGVRGSGEFIFSFGAGDAETSAPMGEPWPEFGMVNISYDDPPTTLDRRITIPHGPRQLWVQTVATENDSTLLPWEAGLGFGRRPTFEGPGATYIGDEVAQQSTATIVLDIGSEPGKETFGIDMRTGDFPVDFVLTGRISTDIQLGSVSALKFTRSGRPSQSSTVLGEPGAIASLAVGGVDERTLVAMGGDGSFLHRRQRRAGAKGEGSSEQWSRVEVPAPGAVAVAASRSGRLELFHIGDDGSPSHLSLSGDGKGKPKWKRLGGTFRYVVPLASRSGKRGSDEEILLFGVTADGEVRALNVGESQDWVPVIDQPARAIAVASVPGVGPAIFAAADDGSLLHGTRRNRRWRIEDSGARVPGDIPTQLLTAIVADTGDGQRDGGQEVIIGAMGEDHQVRVLRWPGYPGGSPRKWEELGSVQELFMSAPEPAAKRRTGEGKRSPKRAA